MTEATNEPQEDLGYYDTDWLGIWRDIRRDARFQGLVVVLILTAILVAWIQLSGDDAFTREDCIQQWRDVGVFARAEELCAEYP